MAEAFGVAGRGGGVPPSTAHAPNKRALNSFGSRLRVHQGLKEAWSSGSGDKIGSLPVLQTLNKEVEATAFMPPGLQCRLVGMSR